MRFGPLLAVAAVVLLLPAVAGGQSNPSPPGAATGQARDVTRTSATLTGTVDPNGSATSYRFEYGTSTAYGLQTAERQAGSGDAPAAAETPVDGLTPDTTYHFRLVATNAAGVTRGEDRTLRTARSERAPEVGTRSVRDLRPRSATLVAAVDPNGGETTVRFEYGRTQAYGSRTPDRPAGSGDRSVRVGIGIGGLEPATRYHFRAVAVNASGTARSANRSFVTPRAPTGIAISLDPSRLVWGHGTVVSGRVSGSGVGGITVALERQDFPFGGPFSSIGTPPPVRAGRNGDFRFQMGALFSTTHLRAITRSRVIATSRVVRARVSTRVGLITRRRANGGTLFRGSVSPEVPDGRASLQRQSVGGGRWIHLEGRSLRPLAGDRSRYTIRIGRRRSDRTYRVVVIARDGGAHVPGYSRQVTIEGRRRR